MFLDELAAKARGGDMLALFCYWYVVLAVCLLLLIFLLRLSPEYYTYASPEERREMGVVGCEMAVRMLPNGTIVFNSWDGNLTCIRVAGFDDPRD